MLPGISLFPPVPYGPGLALLSSGRKCSSQQGVYEFIFFFISLVLEVCLQGTNLRLKHTNTLYTSTNKSIFFMLALANKIHGFQTTRLLITISLNNAG